MADFSNVRILSPEEVANGANPFADPNNGAGGTDDNNGGGQDPNPDNTKGTGGNPNPDGIRILGPDEVVKPAADPNKSDDGGGDDPKPADTGGDVNVSFQKLAEVLSNKGLFELPEDGKVESEDDILDLMRNKVDKQSQDVFNAWKAKLPEKEQAFLGMREAGFDTDEAIQLSDYQEFVTGVNENSDEETLSRTYELYLQMKDLPESEIKDNLESAKDLNKLKEKALMAKTEIEKGIKVEVDTREKRTQAKIASDEKARTDNYNNLMTMIDTKEELIPGINLTPVMKQKIKDSMTKAVETDGDQQLNYVAALQKKNPQGFNVLMHYYAQLGLFNIGDSGELKPDLSKLNRKTKTKDAESIIDAVTGGSGSKEGSDGKPNNFLEKLEKYSKKNNF